MRLGSTNIRINLSVRCQIPKWRVSLCLESPRISHNQGVQGSITKPIRSFLAGNYKTVLQKSEVLCTGELDVKEGWEFSNSGYYCSTS